MEKAESVRRVCKNCGKQFDLTIRQMRQVKEKWPVNCSRSCARIAQHRRNHANIRTSKKCPKCLREFSVAKWNNAQTYCSIKCSNLTRFGDPKERRQRLNKKVSAILNDRDYYIYLRSIAKRIGAKYNVDHDDIFQDFLLALISGHNALIEQTAMHTIRREYNRGVRGKYKAKSAITDLDSNCLRRISKKCSLFDSVELREYLHDLKSVTTEYEFKVVMLMLHGVDRRTSKELIKGSSERFGQAWRKYKNGLS